MFLASRNIFQDKTRLALSIAGVSLALMLILFLNGFRTGLYRQSAAYLNNAPGSLVVVPAGVSSLFGASSLLPTGTEDAVAHLDGVASVAPVLSLIVIPELHGTKEAVFLTGYDPARGGGPWRLQSGREPRTDDEVVVDRLLAQRHGFATGDRIELGGRQFTISGLSDKTTTWTFAMVFARKPALEAALLAPGGTNYLFVMPAAGTAPETLRQRLSALPGVEALTTRQLIANDAKVLGRVYNAPLNLMVGIAFLVGMMVVGLIVYTATVERQREYGVLKAVGIRNAALYQVVAIQAVIAALAGAAGGTVLVFGLARLVMTLRPKFLIAIEPTAIVAALAAGIAMALLAALLPARTIARLAPADVFRR